MSRRFRRHVSGSETESSEGRDEDNWMENQAGPIATMPCNVTWLLMGCCFKRGGGSLVTSLSSMHGAQNCCDSAIISLISFTWLHVSLFWRLHHLRSPWEPDRKAYWGPSWGPFRRVQCFVNMNFYNTTCRILMDMKIFKGVEWKTDWLYC